jgi:hypothetical protein
MSETITWDRRGHCSGVHPQTKLLRTNFLPHICVHSAIWLDKTGLRFWDGAVVGEIQGRAGLAGKGDPPKQHRQVNPSVQMD